MWCDICQRYATKPKILLTRLHIDIGSGFYHSYMMKAHIFDISHAYMIIHIWVISKLYTWHDDRKNKEEQS